MTSWAPDLCVRHTAELAKSGASKKALDVLSRAFSRPSPLCLDRISGAPPSTTFLAWHYSGKRDLLTNFFQSGNGQAACTMDLETLFSSTPSSRASQLEPSTCRPVSSRKPREAPTMGEPKESTSKSNAGASQPSMRPTHLPALL